MRPVSVPAELTRNRWGVTLWKRKTINDLLKKSCECVNRGTQIINGVRTAALLRRRVMFILRARC